MGALVGGCGSKVDGNMLGKRCLVNDEALQEWIGWEYLQVTNLLLTAVSSRTAASKCAAAS